MQLVAFGVAPKIVVVLEDQNSSRIPSLRSKKMRGREATDARTHNDEVVRFVSVGDLAHSFPECAVAQSMHGLKCTGMTAAHASLFRWVVRARLSSKSLT